MTADAAEGRPARVAVDAFPYQRFFAMGGAIGKVAASGVTVRACDSRSAAVWPVEVHLDNQCVLAFGKRQPLTPLLEDRRGAHWQNRRLRDRRPRSLRLMDEHYGKLYCARSH